MYYGENVFVRHTSFKPIYTNNFTVLWGKFLYSIKEGDELQLLYAPDKFKNATVKGILLDDFGYKDNIVKKLPDNICDKIIEKANYLDLSVLLQSIEIDYPNEEKYGFLIMNNKIDIENAVFAYKKYQKKFGEIAFETAQQSLLSQGNNYVVQKNNKTEIIGEVRSDIGVGDILMLVNDLSETDPNIFTVEEIYFRDKMVDRADPAMRIYKLILSGSNAKIKERSRFVLINKENRNG